MNNILIMLMVYILVSWPGIGPGEFNNMKLGIWRCFVQHISHTLVIIMLMAPGSKVTWFGRVGRNKKPKLRNKTCRSDYLQMCLPYKSGSNLTQSVSVLRIWAPY